MAGLIQAPFDPTWPSGWELDRLIDRLVMRNEIATVLTYHEHRDVDWVLSAMDRRGFWATMKTPFLRASSLLEGEQLLYSCGWTPKGVTGWNGQADYWASAPTLPLAIAYASLLTTREGAELLGSPWLWDEELDTDGGPERAGAAMRGGGE